MNGAGEAGTRGILVRRMAPGRHTRQDPDVVAVEEPLDIQVAFTAEERRVKTVAITMRTPGGDRDLAAGFLFSEGILRRPDQVATILTNRNTVRVELARDTKIDWPSLERHVYTSSSCGVCGKTSICAVQQQAQVFGGTDALVTAAALGAMPHTLRNAQMVFESTGGLHAAALFHPSGELIEVREDVGRHNAMDKLIGSQFLAGRIPVKDKIVVVSGRASFELVQKAMTAGVPVLAAVGAPSSLAIDLAHDCRMTLAGFVRDGGFNLYTGAFRVREEG